MKPAIETQNLKVIYDLGKSRETRALDGVDVKVFPREFIIFFGPSGCGKSTLLYTFTGLEKPIQGKVFIHGKDLSLLSPSESAQFHQSSIGMIFQAYYLIPSLTVFDNVSLPQIFQKKSYSERKEKAFALLKRFGIEDQARKLPTELSGGQQQRVAICRALINDPAILLADEPVGNLDSFSAQIVIDMLKEINEKDKKTVALVSHDPRFLNLAHRVYYMEDGKIVREVV